MGNPWAYDFSAIGAARSPLLIVIGSDADASENQRGGFRMLGNGDIYKLLPDNFAFEQLNLAKQFMNHQKRPDFGRFERVLNMVTDPDQHPRTLATLQKLLRGYKGMVINRPEAVLRTTRDKVARQLAGIPGLRVPKVLRITKREQALKDVERARLPFPAILRRTGTHTGEIVGKLEGPEELMAALTEPGDHILTEFVDFASPDGRYRKYRVFVFGGQYVLRHMLVGPDWNVHARERMGYMVHNQELLDEEAALFAAPDAAFGPDVSAVLQAVAKRFPLDYFGMDFGIDRDGHPVLFEANATMNFFPFTTDPRFDYVGQCLPPSRHAFSKMLRLELA